MIPRVRHRETVLDLKPKFKPNPKANLKPKKEDLKVSELKKDIVVAEIQHEPKKKSKNISSKVEDLGSSVESIYIQEIKEDDLPKKKSRKKRKN